MSAEIDIIQANVQAGINSLLAVAKTLAPEIERAAKLINQCLANGGKVLCCGNGGSASDAQHFAAELVGRYVKERQSLAAVAMTTDSSALTAIANDYGYSQVFARQLEGLAHEKDLLLAISTSGNSENIINAIDRAQLLGVKTIALSGKQGGKLPQILSPDDVHLCVPATITARIQEAHIFILHCLCELVDLHY